MLRIVCHSAPGKDPTVIQQGLNLKPPKLEKLRIQNRTDEEIFWIVHHGIKITGMQAFGPTHDDKELWSLVAFIRTLPELLAVEYQAMIEEEGLKEPAGMHAHGGANGPAGNHSDGHCHE